MTDIGGRELGSGGLSDGRNSVCYGTDPSGFNALGDDDKVSFIEALTFEALRALFPKEPLRAYVEATREAHVQHGSLMEIVREHKRTKAYRVAVVVLVRPNGESSSVLVEHEDLRTGVVRRSTRVNLRSLEDLYYLCARIAVRGSEVTLKPRTSQKARWHTQPYATPLTFRLEEMQPVPVR